MITMDAKTPAQKLQTVNKIIVGMATMAVFLLIRHRQSTGYFAHLYWIMGKKRSIIIPALQRSKMRSHEMKHVTPKVAKLATKFKSPSNQCAVGKSRKKACPGALVTSISLSACLCYM